MSPPNEEYELNISDTSCEISATSFTERRVLKHPLHNFSFPTVSWSRNRIFPCVKSNDVESRAPEKEKTVPWNLRKKRRAACFASVSPGRVELESGGKMERKKFSVALSREEIEGDFYLFKGIKPPRRPQKRARIVQRKVDDLFPGLFLEEVTLDSYN